MRLRSVGAPAGIWADGSGKLTHPYLSLMAINMMWPFKIRHVEHEKPTVAVSVLLVRLMNAA